MRFAAGPAKSGHPRADVRPGKPGRNAARRARPRHPWRDAARLGMQPARPGHRPHHRRHDPRRPAHYHRSLQTLRRNPDHLSADWATLREHISMHKSSEATVGKFSAPDLPAAFAVPMQRIFMEAPWIDDIDALDIIRARRKPGGIAITRG